MLPRARAPLLSHIISSVNLKPTDKMDLLQTTVGQVGGSFILGIITTLVWKWWQNKSDVLFFPDEKMPCFSFYRELEGQPNSICRKVNCQYAHNTREKFLANFLLKVFQLGVRVRIITDAHLDRQTKNVDEAERGILGRGGDQELRKQNQNDQIPRLQNAGVPVRLVKQADATITGFMHNKFVIVDGNQLLMGSFNWTHSAVMRNHEAIIKTNERRIVKKFVRRFNQMWQHSQKRPITQN